MFRKGEEALVEAREAGVLSIGMWSGAGWAAADR
jgi:hypothetical protein